MILLQDFLAIVVLGMFVVMLDQHQLLRLPLPYLSLRMRTSSQPPFSFSPASTNLRSPFASHLVGIAFRHPETAVPQHHGAAAILAFGNGAFKITIIEG